MYGTVAILRAKPGMEERLLAFYDRWYIERRPEQTGWQQSFLYQNGDDPQEFVLVGAYDTRENFEAGTSGVLAAPWIEEFYDCLEGERARVTGPVARHSHA